ncbi:nuclear transport factor 2 family protein [Mycolicibacterium farcinogenes]|nr:nuclear transport factor 2 family protein [Mycolicibacterium farcinogenes]
MSETAEHTEIGVEAVGAEEVAQLQAALFRHGLMELERDLDGTMDTVAANPHYELMNVGWRLEGREAVREMYRRMYAGPEPLSSEQRIVGAAPNSMTIEVAVHFDCFEPDTVSRDLTILTFEDGLVASERFYTDPNFTEAMRRALGEDFGEVPGVPRL